ncbi:unnamed protein product [Closterium sp. Naga37s-1]|nr:unnamed protein product [Closterium sp. Naga37s-1]
MGSHSSLVRRTLPRQLPLFPSTPLSRPSCSPPSGPSQLPHPHRIGGRGPPGAGASKPLPHSPTFPLAPVLCPFALSPSSPVAASAQEEDPPEQVEAKLQQLLRLVLECQQFGKARDNSQTAAAAAAGAAAAAEAAAAAAGAIKMRGGVVVHSGAGLSTAAGIPDFRGPKGVWTLQGEGRWEEAAAAMGRKYEEASPTVGHMAVAALLIETCAFPLTSLSLPIYPYSLPSTFPPHQWTSFSLQAASHQTGYWSCTVDGLHSRSRIPSSCLSELHGSVYRERCKECGAKYLRPFDVTAARGSSYHRHKTGRLCTAVAAAGAGAAACASGAGVAAKSAHAAVDASARCNEREGKEVEEEEEEDKQQRVPRVQNSVQDSVKNPVRKPRSSAKVRAQVSTGGGRGVKEEKQEVVVVAGRKWHEPGPTDLDNFDESPGVVLRRGGHEEDKERHAMMKEEGGARMCYSGATGKGWDEGEENHRREEEDRKQQKRREEVKDEVTRECVGRGEQEEEKGEKGGGEEEEEEEEEEGGEERREDGAVCRGELVDSIMHFGERIDDEELSKAREASMGAHVALCLGSSFKAPMCAWIEAPMCAWIEAPMCAWIEAPMCAWIEAPMCAWIEAPMRPCVPMIINLQCTPLDRHASITIRARIDAVLPRLTLFLPPLTPTMCRQPANSPTLSDSCGDHQPSTDAPQLPRMITLHLPLLPSYQVPPASKLPRLATHLVIINLQRTPLDCHASITIRARIDTVLSRLLHLLHLPLPAYHRHSDPLLSLPSTPLLSSLSHGPHLSLSPSLKLKLSKPTAGSLKLSKPAAGSVLSKETGEEHEK